jgi:hypothetical protein
LSTTFPLWNACICSSLGENPGRRSYSAANVHAIDSRSSCSEGWVSGTTRNSKSTASVRSVPASDLSEGLNETSVWSWPVPREMGGATRVAFSSRIRRNSAFGITAPARFALSGSISITIGITLRRPFRHLRETSACQTRSADGIRRTLSPPLRGHTERCPRTVCEDRVGTRRLCNCTPCAPHIPLDKGRARFR